MPVNQIKRADGFLLRVTIPPEKSTVSPAAPFAGAAMPPEPVSLPHRGQFPKPSAMSAPKHRDRHKSRDSPRPASSRIRPASIPTDPSPEFHPGRAEHPPIGPSKTLRSADQPSSRHLLPVSLRSVREPEQNEIRRARKIERSTEHRVAEPD